MTIETMTREDFFTACPEELHEQMREELAQWENGDLCKWITCTVDSMGRIDSTASPRPGNIA